jgi:hypothetical protein
MNDDDKKGRRDEEAESQHTSGTTTNPVHNMAHANGVRCVGPHFTNGKYTLHRGRSGYWPNVSGGEAMTILQELQDE